MDRIQLREEYIQELTRFENQIEIRIDDSLSTLFPYVLKKSSDLFDVYQIRGNEDNVKELANQKFKGFCDEFTYEYKKLTTNYLQYIYSLEDLSEQERVASEYKQQIHSLLTVVLKNQLENRFYNFKDELNNQCRMQQQSNMNLFFEHLTRGMESEIEFIYSDIKNYIMDRITYKVDEYINTLQRIVKEETQLQSEQSNKLDLDEMQEINVFVELVQNEYLTKASTDAFRERFKAYCEKAEMLATNNIPEGLTVEQLLQFMSREKNQLLEEMKAIDQGQEYTETFDGYEDLPEQSEPEDLASKFK